MEIKYILSSTLRSRCVLGGLVGRAVFYRLVRSGSILEITYEIIMLPDDDIDDDNTEKSSPGLANTLH